MRGADQSVRAPSFRLILRTNVAEQRHECLHAGGVAGLDIARGIAHVQALFRFAAGELAGVQHGFRVWLAVCRGVATHDAYRVFLQAELFDERIGEERRLVGDNAPVETARRELIEQEGRNIWKPALRK